MNGNMTRPGVHLQTWGNIGDALTRQGELQSEAGDSSAGQDAFGQAMQAFEMACSMSSSEQGDDLPGLLHNWGVGLSSMADHIMVCSDLKFSVEIWPGALQCEPDTSCVPSYMHNLGCGMDFGRW